MPYNVFRLVWLHLNFTWIFIPSSIISDAGFHYDDGYHSFDGGAVAMTCPPRDSSVSPRWRRCYNFGCFHLLRVHVVDNNLQV